MIALIVLSVFDRSSVSAQLINRNLPRHHFGSKLINLGQMFKIADLESLIVVCLKQGQSSK